MAPAQPASPPKRVTRARAAASKSVDGPNDKQVPAPRQAAVRNRNKATVETEPENSMPAKEEPLRKSARRVGATAGARRIKVTPLSRAPVDEGIDKEEKQAAAQAAAQAPKKTRSTKTKTTITKEETVREAPVKETIKVKRQTVTTKAAVPTQEPAQKARGRPKKVDPAPAEPQPEPRVAARQTRTRAGSGAANIRSLAAAPSKLGAPKKKVTFQDPTEDDKENQPLPRSNAATKAKAASALGLKAKPVRRPVSATASNAKNTQPTKKAEKAKPETATQRVLTPKKVTQIAKSSSPVGTDEDELAGAKTPLKNLTQSPRRNATITKADSPVKKLDFGVSMHASPTKEQSVPALQSPARRQALSPFKDALKESPKRGEVVFKVPQAKPLVASGDQATISSSTLSQSPKRAMLDSYVFPKSPLKATKSPFKASLLKSPPKRLVSPVKVQSVSTKGRPSTPPKHESLDILSPDVALSSHFKVQQSPQRLLRVHKMTAEELQEEVRSTIDFDESIVDIRSPLKVTQAPSVSREVEEAIPEEMTLDHDLEVDSAVAQIEPQSDIEESDSVMVDAAEISEQMTKPEVTTVDPANIPIQKETPVNPSSLLFRGRNMSDDDDSSEDELQSPIRRFAADTPAMVGVKKPHSFATLAMADQKPGFTPLAAQLSGWLASSPDKKASFKPSPKGLFSPVAAQHVPGEIIVDRHSPAVSRISTEPRVSLSAAPSPASRISMTPRSSASVVTNDSPYQMSLFAEAMASKDLEDEIQTMGDDDHDSKVLDTATYEAAVKNIDNDAAFASVSRDEMEDPEKASGNVFGASQMGLSRRSLIFEELLTNFSPGKEDVTITLPQSSPAAALNEHSSPLPEETITIAKSPAAQIVTLGDESPSPVIPGPSPGPNTDFEEESGIIPVTTSPTPSANTPAAGPVSTYRFLTPAREALKPRYAHTVVSKVPLREEGFVSPIKIPKKRSLSVSAGVSPPKRTAFMPGSGLANSKSMPSMPSAESLPGTPYSAAPTPGQQSFMVDDFGDSTLDGIEIDEDDENLPPVTPVTPVTFANARSQAATPCKTPQVTIPEYIPAGVLLGAVVFVDVHTTEGADASGIFVELLTQMGARCVKNWAWNPRASMGANSEGNASTPAGKVGITHVVYKDGGKRTLEKVRDTEGLVKCVGVGWVLDCERENSWIDESTYAIDISVFPRGGSRRRKSMEPRALLNSNGNLTQAGAASFGRRSFSAEMSQKMKEELVNTPVRGRSVVQETRTIDAEDSELSTPDVSMLDESEQMIATTPTGFVNYDPADPAFQTPAPNGDAWNAEMGGASPTTPFYLAEGAKLIQMTCPPKQTGKGLFDADDNQASKEVSLDAGKEQSHRFSVSKKVTRGADGALGRRIADARRRTLGIEAGWKPSVASPLGRH